MQICTSSQTTTPTSHHSVFYRRMPFLPPNQQRQSTEGRRTDQARWLYDISVVKQLRGSGNCSFEVAARRAKGGVTPNPNPNFHRIQEKPRPIKPRLQDASRTRRRREPDRATRSIPGTKPSRYRDEGNHRSVLLRIQRESTGADCDSSVQPVSPVTLRRGPLYKLTSLSTFVTSTAVNISLSTREELSSIEDRDQTDRVTTLPRPHALDSAAAAAGLGRATHALPRWRTADDVTIKTYYNGRLTILKIR